MHNGEARVIPIIIRSADWSTARFSKLQALPQEGKPVASLENKRMKPATDVVKGLRQVVARTFRPTQPFSLFRISVNLANRFGTFRLKEIRFLRREKIFLGRFVTPFSNRAKLRLSGWEGSVKLKRLWSMPTGTKKTTVKFSG